jgi:hypothetical protein
MKKNISLIVTLLTFCGFAQQSDIPAKAFDFLTKYQNVRDISVSSNQKEVYFTLQSSDEKISKIAVSIKSDSGWTKPKLVSFSSAYRDIEPFLSPDNLRLYFASNRPMHDTITTSKDYDIWYVERKTISEDWSAPKNIGYPINTISDEFFPSVSINGNLYYTSENSKSLGKDDIFMSEWKENKYLEPKNLGLTINSSGYEFNAFIDAEERFLIFTAYNRNDGHGSGDLYISYKNKEGLWGKSKNLGKAINSSQMDYCPFYDTTNNTLYFTSKRNSISDRKFENLDTFEKEITKYENGFSRIYKYKIDL